MKKILMNSVAVVVGLLLGGMANMSLVMIGPQLIAPPPGVDMGDVKSLSASIHLLQPRHFLFPFLAHALGAFVGAAVTHFIAQTRRASLAYLIGTLNLAGGIAAAFMIPAPVWFVALDLIGAYLPMAWLGIKLSGQLRR